MRWQIAIVVLAGAGLLASCSDNPAQPPPALDHPPIPEPTYYSGPVPDVSMELVVTTVPLSNFVAAADGGAFTDPNYVFTGGSLEAVVPSTEFVPMTTYFDHQ